ncbi:MAG: hypothetical protein GXP61_00760 [Epsilonproteobacteria bacterium]|nr:hypothetical protein [Campylobacterota bacterium]
MSKIFLLIFLLFCDSSYAKKQKLWDFQYSFNLKKDKIATIFVDKKSKDKSKNNKYALKFRWTLYANKNLIFLVKYMKYPHQYVLQKKRLLDSVQIKLLNDGRDNNGRAYALIIFSDFSQAKQMASFNVYIKDEMKRMNIEFKEPKQ